MNLVKRGFKLGISILVGMSVVIVGINVVTCILAVTGYFLILGIFAGCYLVIKGGLG